MDIRSIPAGGNFAEFIRRSVSACGTLIVLIGSRWMEEPDLENPEDWVRIELETALASGKRIIPVFVNGATMPKPGDLPESLSDFRHTNGLRLDTGVDFELHILRIVTALKGTASVAHAGGIQKARPSGLRIGGIDDVLSWGWTGTKLLEEFIRIDYATLANLDHASEGLPEQWAPVFMEHPDTWRMLLNAEDSIAGYWHMAPLFEDDYALAERGELLDSMITVDRVCCFELGGVFSVYICQFCLLPEYRSTSAIRLLASSLWAVFGELAEHDVFIQNVCANAYTPEGESLSRSFGLSFRTEHTHAGKIFSGSITAILNTQFARRHPVYAHLRSRYVAEGLIGGDEYSAGNQGHGVSNP
jgi:hypothetical protein